MVVIARSFVVRGGRSTAGRIIRNPSHQALTGGGQRSVSGDRQARRVTTDPTFTTSPDAAERLRHGIDRLAAGDRPGAAAAFAAAVEHDPGFALGHAARAAVLDDAG